MKHSVGDTVVLVHDIKWYEKDNYVFVGVPNRECVDLKGGLFELIEYVKVANVWRVKSLDHQNCVPFSVYEKWIEPYEGSLDKLVWE